MLRVRSTKFCRKKYWIYENKKTGEMVEILENKYNDPTFMLMDKSGIGWQVNASFEQCARAIEELKNSTIDCHGEKEQSLVSPRRTLVRS